jgi:hypothetical protein
VTDLWNRPGHRCFSATNTPKEYGSLP